MCVFIEGDRGGRDREVTLLGRDLAQFWQLDVLVDSWEARFGRRAALDPLVRGRSSILTVLDAGHGGRLPREDRCGCLGRGWSSLIPLIGRVVPLHH